MSWYRTYRPRTVAGLHLTTVRESLLRLMATGKLPQVLLFAGPKGTGKTSTARILAAMVNDPANAAIVDHLFFKAPAPAKLQFVEPDQKNELVQRIQAGTSLVVQELDAASNRGIDDVRALRERVALAPAEGKITVYILDEAHMLTTEAFNALLKLLEEPPAHTLFILATTENHKIPATITSRATLIPFTKATPAETSSALASIIEQEKVTIEPAVVDQIAQRADGSFRDAVKMLEQLVAEHTTLTMASLATAGWSNLDQEFASLVSAVVQRQPETVATQCQTWRSRGLEQTVVLKQLLQYLHYQLHVSLKLEAGEPVADQRVLQFLLQELALVPTVATPIPLLTLELKLLELIYRAQAKQAKAPAGGSGSSAPQKSSAAPVAVKKSVPEAQSAVSSVTTEVTIEETPVEVPVVTLPEPAHLSEPLDPQVWTAKWPELIESVKTHNSSLAAILRSARPLVSATGAPQIEVYYSFHREQLQQPKFEAVIEDSFRQVLGQSSRLEYIVAVPPTTVATGKLSADGTPKTSDLASLAAEVLV